MTRDGMNPKVDAYCGKAKRWREEIRALRPILVGCGLTEELKWGKPCYTFEKHNVVVLVPLKEHCAALFAKGALLKDGLGLLTKPGENTQAGRWMKFASVQEVAAMESVLKAYVLEAVAAEKAGLQVKYKAASEYKRPDEFQSQLDANPALKAAFDALTPGRQTAYILHFSAPKQSKTRASRIEKCMARILDGRGLNDG
jgi:uncharacterized protein YdeI (YjbR/CyaY-like superfamily)